MAPFDWESLQEFLRLHQSFQRMAQMVRRDLTTPRPGLLDMPSGVWSPPVDILDQAETLVIVAELPGVERKDIEIKVTGDQLLLRGERVLPRRERRFLQIERPGGRFSRSFLLPKEVNPEEITASLEDGVLEIRIPKHPPATAKRVEVR
jgi:HSP20 family protein